MTQDVQWHPSEIDRASRVGSTVARGATIWLTGLSGSGKSSIAHRCESLLIDAGRAAYTLDGDNLRLGLNADLGFGAADRNENVRRVGEVARLLADSGLIVLAPLISPYADRRREVREKHEAANLPFFEVYVDTPLEVCEARDTKGLYAKARTGEIEDFTGISAPYDAPVNPSLTLDTSHISLDEAAKAVLSLLATTP